MLSKWHILHFPYKFSFCLACTNKLVFSEHKNELRTISSVSIEERHEEEFSNWFSTRVSQNFVHLG